MCVTVSYTKVFLVPMLDVLELQFCILYLTLLFCVSNSIIFQVPKRKWNDCSKKTWVPLLLDDREDGFQARDSPSLWILLFASRQWP